jgi:peptide subunit release factor 1 (eRF1)
MNERIKQLWEEAAKTTQSDSWEEQTKFMERFAELIVKECANYITEYYPHSRYEAFYMKKHFGVEE